MVCEGKYFLFTVLCTSLISSDLQRRSLELEERKYLVGRGVVTETQSNMGKT